jgi:lipopolysaccharide exporter
VSSDDWGTRTRKGILWSTAEFVGGRALTFIAVLILARLLAPADFGVVAATTVYIAVIEVISDVGMKATVIYEQERGISERVQTAFTLNLAVATLLAAIGVAFAPVVAGFFSLGEHADLFRLASLNLLLTGLGNIHDSLLLRELDFRRRIVPELARALMRGFVSIALAVAGFGAAALVFGLLAGTAAWTTFQWILTPLRPTLSLDLGIVRSMAGYGTGAAAVQVVGAFGGIVPVAAIGRALGEQALGLFTVARRVPELAIESVVYNVSRVYFPSLSLKRATEEERLGWATLTVLRYQALCVAPLAACIAVLASPLTVVLFSAEWVDAGPVLTALAVLSGVGSIAFPLGDALKAIGKQGSIIALNAVQIPAIAAGIVLLAPHGIVAVTWLMAGATTCFVTGLGAFACHHLRLRPGEIFRAARPGLVAAAGIALAAGLVRVTWSDLTIGPLVTGVMAGAVGALLLLRLLAPGTLAEVRELVGLRGFSRAAAGVGT